MTSTSVPRLLRGLAVLSVAALAFTSCASAQPAAEGVGAAPPADDESFTVIDELGREVELDGPVERAVVLNSYAVEYVSALGKLDTIVGTDQSIDARWPSFGLNGDKVIAQSFNEINYEAVVALDPDVFILPRNSNYEETTAKLAEFGIPVAVVTTWDATRFEDNIDILAGIFQEQERGDEIRDFYNGIFAVLDEKLADVEPASVYFENSGAYVSFLPGSGYHEALVAARGTNIFEDAPNTGGAFPTATIDASDILTRDPDVVILQYTDSAIEPAASIDDIAEIYASYQERPELVNSRAAREGNVLLVNGTAYNFASKSIWALYIAKWLHPEALADVDVQAYLTEWSEIFNDTTVAPGDDFVLRTDLTR